MGGTVKATRDDAELRRRFVSAVEDADVERIATKMVDAMSSGVGELEADADMGADALAASRAATAGLLLSLDADPWVAPKMPPALGDLARTLARRGEDVTTLLKLTRYGQTEFWPAIMEIAERAVEDPSDRMHLLNSLFDRFGRYVEAVLDQAAADFLDERDSLMRGANARREQTIRALLAGDELNVDSASQTLGYELRRWHTAFDVWDTTGGNASHERLETLARELAQAAGAGRPLTTASSASGLWVWISTDRSLDARSREQLSRLAIDEDLRVSGGSSAIGAVGFRLSHLEAVAAQRIARASDGEAQVTWYRDVEVVSLLSSDPQAARALIARELAGLTGRDQLSAKLRKTVLAFLESGGSATAAGPLLGVHTNTVRYRMEQAEEKLERRVGGQELPLRLALMLVEKLGPDFLPPE
jgi:DNA-binding PucR family transcriptional regulator